MKKILFTLLITAAVCNGWAQQIKVNWGTEYKSDRKESISNMIYDDGKNIYATMGSYDIGFFTKTKVTPSLVKFDEKMKPVKRRDYTTDQKDINYEGTFYLAGSFFILTSTYDKHSNTRELFAQKFNKELEPEGKNTSLWKLTSPKSEDMKIYYNFSEDSTKFLTWAEAGQKKKENKKVAFKVFDGNLKSPFEKEIEFTNTEDQMTIWNTHVSNTNDVFILCKIYKDKKKESVRNESGEKVAAYDVLVKRYSSDGTEKDFTIDMNGRFFDSAYLFNDHTGNLLLIALYENELDKGINGFAFLKVDPKTGSVMSKSEFAIPDALAKRIDKMQGDKPKSKEPGINKYFNLTDFKVLDDGSVYLVLEKNYITEVTGRFNYTVYHSEGMIALKLDKTGKVNWYKYIPKIQFFNDLSAYIHHTTMFYNNKMYIFYNDEVENEKYDLENAPKHPARFNALKKMNVMMIEFDENGKMKHSIFGSTEKMGTNLNMSLTKQLSSSRMVLSGFLYNKSEIKIGTADFQ